MIVDVNYVVNYCNEKIWTLKDSLICYSILKDNSKEIELTLYSKILPKEYKFSLKVLFNKKDGCLKKCIFNFNNSRDKEDSIDINNNLELVNTWVLNNNEYLMKELIRKRNLNLDNIDKFKKFILKNIPISKERKEIKYNIHTSGNKISSIGYRINIASKNNIELLITNNLTSNIRYYLECRIGTNSISGSVEYNLREDKYEFFYSKNKLNDSFRELFNEIDNELFDLLHNKIKINNDSLLLENILDTSTEKFNILSQNFLKEINFNIEEIIKDKDLLTHTVKILKKNVSTLKESLEEMKEILDSEEKDFLQHVFSNNYKKCELIYENYCLKLETLSVHLVKNINDTVTLELDSYILKNDLSI